MRENHHDGSSSHSYKSHEFITEVESMTIQGWMSWIESNHSPTGNCLTYSYNFRSSQYQVVNRTTDNL